MKIYTLECDRSLAGDDTYDAELLDPDLENQIIAFAFPKELKIPKPIYFQANFETLKWNDFPFCNVYWPIISKKILNVLLNVRKFSYQAIPATMLDDTELNEKYFDEKNKPFPHLVNDNFIVLQLLEHVNGFDWNNSVYKMHSRIPNRPRLIRKLVFKEPEAGFPPVFRLSAYPTYLYFTEEAKNALEAANIKGIIFNEVG